MLKVYYPVQFNRTTVSKGFQCSPDKVHAQQSLSGSDRLSSPDSLVPNTDSLVIGSHFGPPHPGRLAQDDGVRLLHLRDLDICALQTEIALIGRIYEAEHSPVSSKVKVYFLFPKSVKLKGQYDNLE